MFKITSFSDLITTREQTRAGFISFAIEKNRRSTPFIEEAKAFKVLASRAKSADELLSMQEIRPALLTASGLSDKALKFFSENDKNRAIKELIDNFLKPAGQYFVDEAVYRYLLIRGDSLGGQMRNIIGAIAQQKLVRTFASTLTVMGIEYIWRDSYGWHKSDILNESETKAICWQYNQQSRTMGFNLKIKTVDKNVDICLFNADSIHYDNNIGKNCDQSAIMFGELKGGIDPAGADEHWKTGNSALDRIRTRFSAIGRSDIKTAFIAAAIEEAMAKEIYTQVINGTLGFAANLTIDEQLVDFCEWIIKL